MKILLFVPCWHRPEIVALFIRNMQANLPEYSDLIPYFVISPEDEDFTSLINLTQGYNRALVKNDPFGHKKNEGLRRAITLEWDYVMEFNSDNIYNSVIWDFYKPLFDNETPFFGLRSVYVYEPYLDKTVFLEGYHIGWHDEVTAMGWGRCIRRDVVEKCMPLWDDTAPFGMDGHSDEVIRNAGYPCELVLTDRDPVVCGIASNICLTAWMQWEECGEACDAGFVRESFRLCPSACLDLTNFDKFHSAVLKVSGDMNRPDAFNLINEAYRQQTGESRYSSYSSYQVTVSKKHKNK